MKKRQTAILTILFCLCLLVSTFGLVFAESTNWVEVITFSEERSRFGETNSFTVDHVEWRILWEYEIDEPNSTAFFFDVINNDTHQLIGNYSNSGKLDITQGIYNITGHSGAFYLDMGSNGLSYSITIEQNLDSIPEFSSWLILPITFVAAAFMMVIKKRFQPSKT